MGKVICDKCGESNDYGYVKCQSCGEKLDYKKNYIDYFNDLENDFLSFQQAY